MLLLDWPWVLSYPGWHMDQPINSSVSGGNLQTQSKEDESYRTFHLYISSKRYKGLALKVDVPYTMVDLTYKGDKRYRNGFTDITIMPSYKWKILTAHAGMALPMGYDSSIDSVWLGHVLPMSRRI